MSEKRLKLLIPVGIVAAGALVVVLLFALRPEPETQAPQVVTPLIRVQELATERVRFEVTTQGTVVPRTESELVPQVSGEVVWVSRALVSGGFFEEGEALVRIDTADYRAAVERARASLARAQSEEARARKELERQRSLADRNIASQARIDDAENAGRVAEAVLREARVALESAQRDLGRTELLAPYAGRVRSEMVDVGQFVNRGTPIGRIYAVDFAEVRLPVPDRELGFLDVPLTYRPQSRSTGEEGSSPTASVPEGPAVTLTARFAGAEHTWRGRIVRTEGEIDPKSRMVTLIAQVEDPYGESGGRPPLAVGLFVRARIQGTETEEAFVLPRTALQEGDRVLVLDDGRLRFRSVEVLRVERDRVVVGRGLAAGDRVCITPLARAVDGMAVRVHDEPTRGVAGAAQAEGADATEAGV